MRHSTSRSASTGSALMVTTFFLVLIAGLSAVTFLVTSNTMRTTRRVVDRSAAISYGDGIIENLFDQWRLQMINVTDTTDRTQGLSTSQLVFTDPSTILSAPTGLTLQSWSVVAADPFLTPVSPNTARPTAERQSPTGLRQRLYYRAQAVVAFRGPTNANTVTVERGFVRGGRNLFEDFLFSTQMITEIHPGAPMYIGKSYIGGDLYTAHNDLHFMESVSYTGTHTKNYRPNDPRFGTAPTIPNGGFSDNWSLSNPPKPGEEQKLLDTQTSSLESVFLDDPTSNDVNGDGNPNNDGYHELIEQPTGTGSDPLQLDISTSERLPQNADYRIVVDAGNNITIYKAGSTTALTSTDPAYTPLRNAVVTNTALKDAREGDNVRLVTLDVSKVLAGQVAGKITDQKDADGLVIYVADTSTSSVSTKIVNSATSATTAVTSNHARGVKLINGASLPSTGLTVVSPNPVYIQGDYNTGTTSTSKPASNTATSYTPPADTPSPSVTGYNRAPAAVVGDAVNILSNSWNDANSLLSKSSRAATNTTINAAIIAGNVPTTTNSYSGGIENFVRFHESWSNDYFTIYGALALLYASQQAKGPWSSADYDPPNRRWYYDPIFADKNPPGIRVARIYSRGSWTVR